MREVHVEDYLTRRVKELGGEVRKVMWAGRKHAPDRLVLLPGKHFYVELKRPGEMVRGGQLREHIRLRASGVDVRVANSKEGVDHILSQ